MIKHICTECEFEADWIATSIATKRYFEEFKCEKEYVEVVYICPNCADIEKEIVFINRRKVKNEI